MTRNTGAEINSQSEKKQLPSGRVADSFPSAYGEAETALACEMRISVDRVHKLYCIVLERLSKDARIRDYLPILVTKKVRNLMQKKLEIQNTPVVTESGVLDDKTNRNLI